MTNHSIKDLLKFNPALDKGNMIGDRFLCRGGTLLIAGPSGVGKSTLVLQMACRFAQGLDFFGIEPSAAFKVLYVQAENDMGDLAEICRGLQESQGFSDNDPAAEQINANLMIVTEDTSSGEDFIKKLSEVVKKTKPDLIVIDPLLSYIGGDISQQEVVSRFMRQGLNPLLREANAACICVHHMGKGGGRGAYAAMGSSELINHARAVINLQTPSAAGAGYDLELFASKRGKRLGLTDADGYVYHGMVFKYGSTRFQSFERVNVPSEAQGKPSRKRDMAAIKAYLEPTMSKADAARVIAEKEGVGLRQARRIYDEIA